MHSKISKLLIKHFYLTILFACIFFWSCMLLMFIVLMHY